MNDPPKMVHRSTENVTYHTEENNHQWLDENGWLHRNAYVINAKNGSIYKITVDIAKARDGRVILYATNGKTQKVGSVQVNSLELRGSGQDSNSSGNSVPQNQKNATENSENTPFSLSEESNKKSVTPTKGWKVSGKDLAITPIGESVKRKTNTGNVVPEGFPIRKDIAPAQKTQQDTKGIPPISPHLLSLPHVCTF